MTQHEFNYCTKSSCWIPSLLDKGYVALWPLICWPENRNRMHVWSFQVSWTKNRSTKVNKAFICEKHHRQLLRMFESEMAADVREQEATDRWLIAVSSQMLLDPSDT